MERSDEFFVAISSNVEHLDLKMKKIQIINYAR